MRHQTAIAHALGFDDPEIESASGGCINESFTLTGDDGRRVFAKCHPTTPLAIFEAEAAALAELAASETVRVPRPIASGQVEGYAYLALEYIAMGKARDGSWERFGRELAALHRTNSDRIGWHLDNVIGATPQPNPRETSWAKFFVEHRLRHQFNLATRAGFHFDRSSTLLDRAAALLDGHNPDPALLHGDLWSGNIAFDDNGAPVIFDPATYFGDPETDLAFTEMFGGFPSRFYAAYDAAKPPAPGRYSRKRLYNLYHLLNHTNLFGGSYAHSSQAAIDEILR